MHPLFYLFKLSIVIILSTFQSCFFSSKQNLSQHIPCYTVSLRSEKPTGYFEDQKIPIDIFFSSEDENIKDNGIRLRIKNIFIEGVDGHLETETGDLLEHGFEFVYKSDGYQLFFIPDSNTEDDNCTITIVTLLVDKNGNEAPESSHKIASCKLYICHKEGSIEETIQEEETKFSATLTPLTENHFCHKESKWELNITSDLNDATPYKIIDLQLEQGILQLDDTELKVGDALTLGKQELVFVPNGFIGKFSPTIVIENSKLLTTTVSLEENDYLFQDAGFCISTTCGKNISLTVGGKHLLDDEEWIVEDWSFQGGLTGNLYNTSNNSQITKQLKLQAGTTYIDCAADIQNLSGTPIVVFSIMHPDGKKETIQVDISSIVLPILESKLAECTTLLSDSIDPTTDLNTRKETINQSKDILVKMGFLSGEADTEKTKAASMIDAYRSFLKENKAAFNQSIHISELESRAASSVERASHFTYNMEAIFSLKQDQQAIVSLLNEVTHHPELFSHMANSIENIRAHLSSINDAIENRERAKYEHDGRIARELEAYRNQNASLERDLQKSNEELNSLKILAIENERKSRILLFLKDKTAEEKKMAIGKLIHADDVDTLDDLFGEIGQNCIANSSTKENIKLIDYAISCRAKKVIGYLLDKGEKLNESVIYDYLKNRLQYFDKIDYEVIELLLSKGAVLDHHIPSDIYVRHSDFKKVDSRYNYTCSNYNCTAKEKKMTALHFSFVMAKLNNWKIDPFEFLVKQGASQSAIMYIDWECGRKDNFDMYDLKS